MHAVNNGPVGSKVRQGNSTYPYFKEAGIPYARNHDASFHEGYGGEYAVDVHRIFRNFDADPCDPKNYDFECNDMCVADTLSVGNAGILSPRLAYRAWKKGGDLSAQGL